MTEIKTHYQELEESVMAVKNLAQEEKFQYLQIWIADAQEIIDILKLKVAPKELNGWLSFPVFQVEVMGISSHEIQHLRGHGFDIVEMDASTSKGNTMLVYIARVETISHMYEVMP